MRAYRYAELAFAAPERWMDLSVVSLAAPSSSAYAPNIVLTRETASRKKKIAAVAKGQLPELKRSMKKHRLVAQDDVEIDGEAAYRMEHRFLSVEKVEVHQLQYFFRTGDDDVAVLSLTCAVDALDEHRPLFENIAASVRREPTTD